MKTKTLGILEILAIMSDCNHLLPRFGENLHLQ